MAVLFVDGHRFLCFVILNVICTFNVIVSENYIQ